MSIVDLDMGEELNAMNELFKANSKNFFPPPKPVWLKPDDRLSLFYDEFSVLMRRGELFWANIVQANNLLFKPLPRFSRIVDASVAEIVYNHKRPKTAESDPLILRTFAHYLFESKGKPAEELPEWLREASAVITDEFDRSRVVIKAGERDDFEMNLTMQAIIVFRAHIPRGALKNSLLPIIAAPYKCESAMILPSLYWTRGFLKYWRKS